MTNRNHLNAYQAALESAAFSFEQQRGCFWISGPDQVAFLQRQTTNDLRQLRPGHGILTVLTSPTARIIDVFYLYLSDPDPDGIGQPNLVALSLPGQSSQTYQFLKSRIFFMDKVEVTDHSSELIQFDLIGPGTNTLLTEIGASRMPQTDEIFRVHFQGMDILAVNPHPCIGFGIQLLMGRENQALFQDILLKLGVIELDATALEILRVEAGIPAAGHELTQNYTPLESGLQPAISGSKGCYTGQEILARQVTYDKVTQSLCELKLTNSLADGSQLEADGRVAGVITSSVHSPRFGDIALAIIKRPYNQPGTKLHAGSDSAVVCELPFR